MQLTLKDDLPFTQVQLVYGDLQTVILDVLVDTGSASTILAAHAVALAGIVPEV